MMNILPGGGLGGSASRLLAGGLGAPLAEFRVEEAPGGSSIIAISNVVERKLIEHLARHPNELKLIDRRRFEELVAELFSGSATKLN